jgi:hypothetical protein
MNYLEATGSQIIEKHPAYVTVKLSPAADKDLTNRPYYWGFVERTGTEPETMTFTFIFDPEKHEEMKKQKASAQPSPPAPGLGQPAEGDSILSRYFGFVPTPPAIQRVPSDVVTYGSRRLEQIFDVARNKGKYVCLYEDPAREQKQARAYMQYSTWLCVNWKVEFICDMKRDELHSLGINLASGEIVEQFHELLLNKKLTPRLPEHVHTPRRSYTLAKAVSMLEQLLEKKIKKYDHSWADEARERLTEELERIDSYYESLLKPIEDEEAKQKAEEQYNNRKAEIEWQYTPRVEVNAINCGIFHIDPTYA